MCELKECSRIKSAHARVWRGQIEPEEERGREKFLGRDSESAKVFGQCAAIKIISWEATSSGISDYKSKV